MANLTENAAWANIVNPRIPTTGSWINNNNLPVSFIPAQIFGGPEGTFREVKFGQQYITTFTAVPQVDVINVARWQDVRSAKVNTALVTNETALTKKKMQEQVNVLYCNILMLQEQRKVLTQFVGIADSLAKVVENKYNQGIVRLQDWNDARVNVLQQQGSLRNLEMALVNQLETLSVICGNNIELEVASTDMGLQKTPLAQGKLELDYAALKVEYARMMHRSAQLEQLPVLSLQGSLGYQNNSNAQWMDPNSRWIYSSFVGAKLTWDLPTNAVKVTQVGTRKINYEMAKIAWEEEQRNAKVRNEQLNREYEKVQQDYLQQLQISSFDFDSYQHVNGMFKQDVVGLDKLLLSQQKALQSELSAIGAKWNSEWVKNKIHISNAK
jgi:outer membrane protein TolC